MIRWFLLIFFFLCSPILYAQRVSTQEALQIAGEQLGTNRLEIRRMTETYIIVQREDSVGYIILFTQAPSKIRIIGFSDNSAWNENKLPPLLLTWLDKLQSEGSASEPQIDPIDISENTKQSVSPLLTCHWHQNSPYNDLAPVITDGNVKTVTGCVATAAAQIVYYWRKDNPDCTLRNTPTYTYGGAPVTEVIPKGTPNHWELMLDEYDETASAEQRASVAQLCYVLGTTSYLNYASSTGGSIREASTAMNLQYNLKSQYLSKRNIQQQEWENIIYSDLERGYPILCSGHGSGGHAFVVDGYDHKLNLFHINFGWGGSGDGYYPVDDSDVAMGGYNTDQAIVYNIHPVSRRIEASLYCSYDKGKRVAIHFVSKIRNSSTLPIKKLLIFGVPENSNIEETDTPLWEGPIIENDGIEHTITDSFRGFFNLHYELVLTDEQRNELARCSFDENAIESIETDKVAKLSFDCYNSNGQKVSPTNKGLYIIDYGTHKKKIIKTK